MFSLTPDDLSGRILDCAADPASFNAEATQRGVKVTSCDPIYRVGKSEIRACIQDTFDTLISNATARHEVFRLA